MVALRVCVLVYMARLFSTRSFLCFSAGMSAVCALAAATGGRVRIDHIAAAQRGKAAVDMAAERLESLYKLTRLLLFFLHRASFNGPKKKQLDARVLTVVGRYWNKDDNTVQFGKTGQGRAGLGWSFSFDRRATR